MKLLKPKWKEYPGDEVLFPYSLRWWHSDMADISRKNRIYADVIEYPFLINNHNCPVYEATMQLRGEESICSHTINIKLSGYEKLDWKQIEKDLFAVIKKLVR